MSDARTHHTVVYSPATPRRTRNLILVWIDAWREYARLQKLDDQALADMGLTEHQRASVKVRHIVARMRG